MIEELKNKPQMVLDKGFVTLIDVMGSDEDICAAARISYGKGTKKVSNDRNLIRYLMRNKHTSVFEMAEMKFHIKCPIYVMRQLVRHRTANLNEYSARYSEMIDDVEVVEYGKWRSQSTENKQGSGKYVSKDTNDFVREKECDIQQLLCGAEEEVHRLCKETYEYMLSCGVAREQARKIMPLDNYTEVVWKCDLHNILHLLKLRTDSHAQLEIREYANTISSFVKELFPMSYEAFKDYVLDAVTFSGIELDVIKYLTKKELFKSHPIERLSTREKEELKIKLKNLGISQERFYL
jgi:thymidylate synthase (FAD)